MTSPAGRNVPSAGLRPGSVTTKTSGVRTEVRRNCHRDAVADWTMTSIAIHAAHRHMFRVVELHAKAHQSIWKRLDRARLRVAVADGADRTL